MSFNPALSPSPSTASQEFPHPISPSFQNFAESIEKELHNSFEEEVINNDTITDEEENEIRPESKNFTTDFNVNLVLYNSGVKSDDNINTRAGSDSWKYFHWSSMLTYN